ncbi:MAG TPA: Crp/Fnr family transcriptional regulator [Coleofasciculaceae cyanobacterium]
MHFIPALYFEDLMVQQLKLEPARTVAIFQRQPDPKFFTAGEVIFEDGQPGDYLYGILEGTVDLVVDGNIIETIEAGSVFGAGALIHPDGIRVYTAIARTDCKLAYMDQARLLFAVQETPMFALEVMRNYSDRLRRLTRHPLDLKA